MNSKSLNDLLSRFSGRNFVVYGDNIDLISQVQKVGQVLLVFSEKADISQVPIRQSYDKLFESIYDAIYVVLTNGNMGNRKVETSIMDILRNKENSQKVVILVGYPDFVSVGLSVVTEKFEGGIVVGPRNDITETLQETSEALKSNVDIPVSQEDIDSIPGIDELLPYIHISSRIKELGKIPITKDLPTNILPTNDKSRMIPYDSNRSTTARNWGQRKLLVSEIELMNNIYRKLPESQQEGVIFVYVGSAPGIHIPRLVDMFIDKNPIFHLWDRIYATGRNNFLIPESDNIKITPQEFRPLNYEKELLQFVPDQMKSLSLDEQIRSVEGFFTDGVMDMYKKAISKGGIYVFISDIRDNSSDEAVMRDMELQQKWVLGMNPFASHLKFRLPFIKQDEYEYLKGDIYTQAWSRNKSTEMRLLSFSPYTKKVYNTRDYEEACAYFNLVTRVSSYDMSKINSSLGRWIRDTQNGLCTCHDCAKEVQILVDYMNLLEYDITEESIIQEIRRNTECCNTRRMGDGYRTLWNKVSIKTPPYDRRHLVLFKTQPTEDIVEELNDLWHNSGETTAIDVSDRKIDQLLVASYNNIVVYGDGYSLSELVDLLKQKKDLPILRCPRNIEGCNEAIDLLPQVLKGIEFTVVINFHTDFINVYDPKKDFGSQGQNQYNRYLQQIALAQQQGLLGQLSSLAHLNLFAIPRATLKRK